MVVRTVLVGVAVCVFAAACGGGGDGEQGLSIPSAETFPGGERDSGDAATTPPASSGSTVPVVPSDPSLEPRVGTSRPSEDDRVILEAIGIDPEGRPPASFADNPDWWDLPLAGDDGLEWNLPEDWAVAHAQAVRALELYGTTDQARAPEAQRLFGAEVYAAWTAAFENRSYEPGVMYVTTLALAAAFRSETGRYAGLCEFWSTAEYSEDAREQTAGANEGVEHAHDGFRTYRCDATMRRTVNGWVMTGVRMQQV